LSRCYGNIFCVKGSVYPAKRNFFIFRPRNFIFGTHVFLVKMQQQNWPSWTPLRLWFLTKIGPKMLSENFKTFIKCPNLKEITVSPKFSHFWITFIFQNPHKTANSDFIQKQKNLLWETSYKMVHVKNLWNRTENDGLSGQAARARSWHFE